METFCLELLRAWVAQGIGATLYVSHHGGDRECDIPVRVERVCWDIRAKLVFLKLACWLRKRSNDPCLALSQELAVVLLILKKLRIIRNRIYFRESSDVVWHYNARFKHLMRWLWPSLDGIIEQSHVGEEATRKICEGKLPPCLVVRNIMPTPLVQSVSWAFHQPIQLACIGSFKPMKGQRYLVEELIEEANPDWHLTFWGDGADRNNVFTLVRNKVLEDRVCFHDWEHDKEKIYAVTDVVVIPSDYEGLPNVMLEAILYRKRVSVRPTCVGACELLNKLGVPDTWPWRKALEISEETWNKARNILVEICNPSKVAETILEFMS